MTTLAKKLPTLRRGPGRPPKTEKPVTRKSAPIVVDDDDDDDVVAPKKRGRPAKVKTPEVPAPKKRGRPPGSKSGATTETPKKRGRPAKAKVAEEPRRGRPAKATADLSNADHINRIAASLRALKKALKA